MSGVNRRQADPFDFFSVTKVGISIFSDFPGGVGGAGGAGGILFFLDVFFDVVSVKTLSALSSEWPLSEKTTISSSFSDIFLFLEPPSRIESFVIEGLRDWDFFFIEGFSVLLSVFVSGELKTGVSY